MKKYMMDTYKIPEYAILIDPCGRHTTTNLRNGIRHNKKSLIITIKAQNEMIEANAFATRCYNELGYFPGTLGSRISDVRLEFTPNSYDVLTTNAIDPLDP